MAHLVNLAKKCMRCPSRASVEVFNARNASLGVYCSRCGKRRLAEIERAERPLAPRPSEPELPAQ